MVDYSEVVAVPVVTGAAGNAQVLTDAAATSGYKRGFCVNASTCALSSRCDGTALGPNEQPCPVVSAMAMRLQTSWNEMSKHGAAAAEGSNASDANSVVSIAILPFDYTGAANTPSDPAHYLNASAPENPSAVRVTAASGKTFISPGADGYADFVGNYYSGDIVATAMLQRRSGLQVNQKGIFRFRFFVGSARVPIFRVSCNMNVTRNPGTESSFRLRYTAPRVFDPTGALSGATTDLHASATPAMVQAALQNIPGITKVAVVFGNRQTTACSPAPGGSAIFVFLEEVQGGIDSLSHVLPTLTVDVGAPPGLHQSTWHNYDRSGNVTVTPLFLDSDLVGTPELGGAQVEMASNRHSLRVVSQPRTMTRAVPGGGTGIPPLYVRGYDESSRQVTGYKQGTSGVASSARFCNNITLYGSVWQVTEMTPLCGTVDVAKDSTTVYTTRDNRGMIDVGQQITIEGQVFVVLEVADSYIRTDRAYPFDDLTGLTLYVRRAPGAAVAQYTTADFDCAPEIQGWVFAALTIHQTGSGYYVDLYDAPERPVYSKASDGRSVSTDSTASISFYCDVEYGSRFVYCKLLDASRTPCPSASATMCPTSTAATSTYTELWGTRVRFGDDTASYFINCPTVLNTGAYLITCTNCVCPTVIPSGVQGAYAMNWTLASPYLGATRAVAKAMHVQDWTQSITVSGLGLSGSFSVKLNHHQSEEYSPEIGYGDSAAEVEVKINSMPNVRQVKVFTITAGEYCSVCGTTAVRDILHVWRVVFLDTGFVPMFEKHQQSMLTAGGSASMIVADESEIYYNAEDTTYNKRFFAKHSTTTAAISVGTTGSGSTVSFVNEPTVGRAGEALSPQPIVEYKDASGVRVPGANGAAGFIRATLATSAIIQEFWCTGNGGTFTLVIGGQHTAPIAASSSAAGVRAQLVTIWKKSAHVTVVASDGYTRSVRLQNNAFTLSGMPLTGANANALTAAAGIGVPMNASLVTSAHVLKISQTAPPVITACAVGHPFA